jgi:hypothetical protein
MFKYALGLEQLDIVIPVNQKRDLRLAGVAQHAVAAAARCPRA